MFRPPALPISAAAWSSVFDQVALVSFDRLDAQPDTEFTGADVETCKRSRDLIDLSVVRRRGIGSLNAA